MNFGIEGAIQVTVILVIPNIDILFVYIAVDKWNEELISFPASPKKIK